MGVGAAQVTGWLYSLVAHTEVHMRLVAKKRERAVMLFADLYWGKRGKGRVIREAFRIIEVAGVSQRIAPCGFRVLRLHARNPARKLAFCFLGV